MQKYIKQCQVCGADYEACSFCERQNEFLAWRSVVCKPEHFAYHIPIISYIRKQITKEEAKEQLLKVEKDYGKIEYSDNIKSIVAEIKADITINKIEKADKSAKAKTRTKKVKTQIIDEVKDNDTSSVTDNIDDSSNEKN